MTLNFFQWLQMIGILYLISFGAMYYLSGRAKGPIVLPGDIYYVKGGRKTYIPTGGAAILTVVAFFIIWNFVK